MNPNLVTFPGCVLLIFWAKKNPCQVGMPARHEKINFRDFSQPPLYDTFFDVIRHIWRHLVPPAPPTLQKLQVVKWLFIPKFSPIPYLKQQFYRVRVTLTHRSSTSKKPIGGRVNPILSDQVPLKCRKLRQSLKTSIMWDATETNLWNWSGFSWSFRPLYCISRDLAPTVPQTTIFWDFRQGTTRFSLEFSGISGWRLSNRVAHKKCVTQILLSRNFLRDGSKFLSGTLAGTIDRGAKTVFFLN